MFRKLKKRLFLYLLISGILLHLGAVAGAILLPSITGQGLLFLADKAIDRSRLHPYHAAKLKRLLPTSPGYAPLPTFPGPKHWSGQGVTEESLAYPVYTNGRPASSRVGVFIEPLSARQVTVTDAESLRKAINGAKAGDIITLAPGVYHFSGRSIPAGDGGSPNAPVIVRADRPGEVRLEFNMLEGFHVKTPYWVFENLEIKGVCNNHNSCEHAFHVVGEADGIIIRNNQIIDFNAAVKVNSLPTKQGLVFPDHGLIENNTVFNTGPRKTANPVTTLNLNSGNGWVVRANFIADFYKNRGDKTSYGAFMKGNSQNGLFERNLIVCSWRIPREDRTPIALSLGGGGTGNRFCRNQDCSTEHRGGVIRNNIITRCGEDVGIYLNRAAESRIINNIIQGSLGIDVRFATSSAVIVNNILDGRIHKRDQGFALADNNLFTGSFPWYRALCSGCQMENWFRNPRAGDFRRTPAPLPKAVHVDGLTEDFCGSARAPEFFTVGAIGPDVPSGCLPQAVTNAMPRLQ